MKVIVLGLDHDTQCRDSTGELLKLLEGLVRLWDVDLIAEEAHTLPTTVAQGLASRLAKPWIDIDMDDTARLEAGIYEECKKYNGGPLFEEGEFVGWAGEYPSSLAETRETYWVARIFEQQVSSAIILCGALHLSSLSKKLMKKGCEVQQIQVWKFDWYKRSVGNYEISEDEGTRTFRLTKDLK